MKFSDVYLPLGLILAFVLAFFYPSWGEYLFHINLFGLKINQIIIFLIFGISGYLLKFDNFRFNSHLLISLSGGIIISMLCAPLLALILLHIIPLNAGLTIGVLTISCVPPTMATGIISTTISKGNTTWAIVFTIVLNAVGVLIVPFTFDNFVDVVASQKINALAILQSLFLLVVLPAIIGFFIKKKWGMKKHFLFTYFQPSAIIFIAFCTVAAGRNNFTKLTPSSIILLLITVIILHFLLIGVCLLFSKIKKLKLEETKAFTFVCSQKTLPLALSILAILPTEIATLATIPCLLYHLSQVFIDSFIAYFWQKKQDQI